MRKVFYNKLIRDKIPEHIRGVGEDCEFHLLDNEGFEKALFKKLGEETAEVQEAFENSSREEIVKELADVHHILNEIKSLKGISDEEIGSAISAKIENKGGFDKRMFLLWSTDVNYAKNNNKITEDNFEEE
tara:strand:- start:2184 stop:2576 length:393 start_codon:yes stop_codon:yes gene_type:complete